MVLSATTRAVRILSAMVLCSLTALPLQSFPGFQKILSDAGVYNEKCAVNATSDIICVAQRQAFERMFEYGGLCWPFAAALALTALTMVGFIFTEVCGSLLLAGGALLLSDSAASANDSALWNFDPYLCGYALICSGSPFVLAGSLDTLLSFSWPWPLPMATILIMCMQLSPLVWPIGFRVLQPDSLSGFFRYYLWIPLIILILTLPLMPFSDSEPPSQESSPTAISQILRLFFPEEERIEHEEALPSSYFPRKYRNPFTFRYFFFSLGYGFSMTVLNLLAATYDIRGHFFFGDHGPNIWQLWAPLSASIGVIPAIWTLKGPRILAQSYSGGITLVTIATAMQLQTISWQVWLLGILVAHAARVFLTWKMMAVVFKLTGRHYFLVSVGYVWVITSLLQIATFSSLEYYTIFDDHFRVHFSCFIIVAELITAWLSFKTLARDWYITRRAVLEREATECVYFIG